MAHRQLIFKEPQADLRRKYPRMLEVGLILSLLLVAGMFFAFKRFEKPEMLQPVPDETIVVEEVPPTSHRKPPPPPPRPRIPIVAEHDDDVPIDEPFDDRIFDPAAVLGELPLPPDEPAPEVPFYALSDKPQVLHRVIPEYPPMALRGAVEGMVVLRVLVDEHGEIEKIEITRGHVLFDEAAIAAVRQFKFKPGSQRERPVKVWMHIPFNFRLKGN